MMGDRRFGGIIAATLLVAHQAIAAISTTGNVTPVYPGSTDPWNLSGELRVGNSGNASVSITDGSDVTSVGGTLAFDPGISATVLVSGLGSSWTNTRDLTVGVFGSGQLTVVDGGLVANQGASLGHINGPSMVLVQGTGSQWLNTADVIVGNGADGTLTVQQQGRVTCNAAWVGLNTSAVGVATIDGSNSRWEVARTLSLGDVSLGGQGTVTLSGAGSRLYLGAAAVTAGASLPSAQTAVIISDTSGLAALTIYGGNKLHNAGQAYVGFGVNDFGSVTVNGAGSEWTNSGAVSIGMSGMATLTLVAGGSVSSTSLLTIGDRGTVQGNGTLAASTLNNGTLSPGLSAGSLATEGNYTQSAPGKLEIELFGTGAGQFDTLNVQGSALLGGALQVTLGSTNGDSFSPQIGDTFAFLTATNGVSSTFATTNLPPLPAGRMWQLRYGSSTTLAVTLAGDYNDNGTVDDADYVLWRKLKGLPLNHRADGDTNGVIDAADYGIWQSRFGAMSGATAAAGLVPDPSYVPEPVAMGSLVPAVVLGCIARRRRQWKDD